MLDNITKKNIDDCRDILVGKVPDPKSQIEQITLALIYKFMDDMDKEIVEKYKSKAKFFIGEYEKYGWRRLFDPSLGGQKMLEIYGEALEKLSFNQNIPELFRNIFKNAFLPYRDPNTLKMFLKIINNFEYSHSEKLGDAFEYLLSIMGSQGDAGQFRTPRHIIDFVTECLSPQKNEIILDPACGTAGFLLSAYKYILKNNTNKITGDNLNPDERRMLASNIVGYDISPDMVRISLANMYLHGFKEPHIYEYDTLSSEERWNEKYDVILANPPFMTPKGGIIPHKKFGVQANKAEVLFTDYIAEHLEVNGRAGIIVPNGIISTSHKAYKQLRKMLVDKSLLAVISLPAGVFNPYSDVKTFVLILDKKLSKKSKNILFLKIENDGFDLGAKRREIEKNDLPLALKTLIKYKEALKNEKDINELPSLAKIVEKSVILKNNDIGLSVDRYFEKEKVSHKFKLIKINDSIEDIKYTNKVLKKDYLLSGKYPIIDQSEKYISGYWNKNEDVYKIIKPIVIFGDHTRIIKFIDFDFVLGADGVKILQPKDFFDPKFFYYILKNITIESLGYSRHFKELKDIEIPLPPLEIQKEIVSEIERYQNIIDGAKKVVDNYKPTIKINPKWEMVELGEVCDIYSGGTPSKNIKEYWEKGTIPWVGSSICKDKIVYKSDKFITDLGFKKSNVKMFSKHTTLIALVGATIGKTAFLEFETTTNQNIAGLKTKNIDVLIDKYLFYISNSLYNEFYRLGDSSFRMASLKFIKELKIPLPFVMEQISIVKSIEEEIELVNANKRLIEIFEKKIKDKINEVWGENIHEKEYKYEDEPVSMAAENVDE